MRNYAQLCGNAQGICSYSLVYKFLIQLLTLKISVYVVHLSNVFCHRNKPFLKGSFENEIVPFLVLFHLPYSKYRAVKIYFHSCLYQNQVFSLVSHSCRFCSTCAALLSFVQHFCRTGLDWNALFRVDKIIEKKSCE